jgi:thioredoxin-related protein
MRKFLIFIVIFLLPVLSARAVDFVPAENFFDQSFEDMPEELAVAQEDGKKALLIMFEMDECPFCHWMKDRVLNRKDVQDYFKDNFRIIKVDVEGDVEVVDFKGNSSTQKDMSLKQFRVRATPVFQFMGLDGKPVPRARLTGSTKNADEFLKFGKYVAEGHFKQMSFSKFKRLDG